MNDKDIEKLKDLVSNAVTKDMSKLKSAGQHHSPHRYQFFNFNREIDPEILAPLVDFLNSIDDIVILFNNKVLNMGNGGVSVTLPILAKWLIISTEQKGVQVTVNKLISYLDLDNNSSLAYLAVSGVAPSEPIEISESITLFPFDSLPSSFPKDSFDPPYLKEKFIRRLGFLPPNNNHFKSPKGVLIKKFSVFPKVYSQDDEPHAISEHTDLEEACEFFTLCSKNATPVRIGSWIELDDSIPCKQIAGGGWGSPLPDVISSKDVTISQNEWDGFKNLYSMFRNLGQKDRDILRIPIQRINQARRRANSTDKAIDQGVAFEALFLNDKTHKDQISYTFRLRASLFLGEDIEEREKLMSFFTAFYSCRSQAAHTGKLSSKIKVSFRGKLNPYNLLQESDELCVKAICKIIEKGRFPDWNKLILTAASEY